MPLLANPHEGLWHAGRPRLAPAGTLLNATTMRGVDHEVYVLAPENFDRAEQAIALCLAHGLMVPAR